MNNYLTKEKLEQLLNETVTIPFNQTESINKFEKKLSTIIYQSFTQQTWPLTHFLCLISGFMFFKFYHYELFDRTSRCIFYLGDKAPDLMKKNELYITITNDKLIYKGLPYSISHLLPHIEGIINATDLPIDYFNDCKRAFDDISTGNENHHPYTFPNELKNIILPLAIKNGFHPHMELIERTINPLQIALLAKDLVLNFFDNLLEYEHSILFRQAREWLETPIIDFQKVIIPHADIINISSYAYQKIETALIAAHYKLNDVSHKIDDDGYLPIPLTLDVQQVAEILNKELGQNYKSHNVIEFYLSQNIFGIYLREEQFIIHSFQTSPILLDHIEKQIDDKFLSTDYKYAYQGLLKVLRDKNWQKCLRILTANNDIILDDFQKIFIIQTSLWQAIHGISQGISPRNKKPILTLQNLFFIEDEIYQYIDNIKAGSINIENDHIVTAKISINSMSSSGALSTERKPNSNIFTQNGDFWIIKYKDQQINLKHKLGLAYLQFLLKNPEKGFSSLELEQNLKISLTSITSQEELFEDNDECELNFNNDERFQNQQIVDKTAIIQYKTRLNKINDEIEIADDTNNSELVAQLKNEQMILQLEISKALNPSQNKFANPAKRINDRVRKAINDAKKAINKHHPPLSDYFSKTLRITNSTYSYVPELKIEWEV